MMQSWCNGTLVKQHTVLLTERMEEKSYQNYNKGNVSDVRAAAKVMKDETGMMKKNMAMLQARMRAILTAWNASQDLITFSARHIASSHPACISNCCNPLLR